MPKRPPKPVKKDTEEYRKQREEGRRLFLLNSSAKMKHIISLQVLMDAIVRYEQETRNRVDVLLEQLEDKRSLLPGMRIFHKGQLLTSLQLKRADVLKQLEEAGKKEEISVKATPADKTAISTKPQESQV